MRILVLALSLGLGLCLPDAAAAQFKENELL